MRCGRVETLLGKCGNPPKFNFEYLLYTDKILFFVKNNEIMAMAINNIPVLKGKVAEDFVRKAEKAEKERGTIDLSKQRIEMRAILAKAKL